jgi:thiol-disulfide isomerase/thioredoxin
LITADREVEGAPAIGELTAPADFSADLPPPLADSLPANVALDDLGQAPEVRDITAWINSEPVSLTQLRGKVVLVHFWTFGCINCIHVQPYVKAWYERYSASGLVVLGVHTPELSFERDIESVRKAVADSSVQFPVAFDPSYGTWQAYGNHYWPAFYFVDRAGHIRHIHFGEGDYGGSEQVIRQLLAEPG